MIIKLPIKTMNIEQLNDECLDIIAQFSEKLRQHNGTVIDTEDHCIVKQIALHAKISQCDQLQSLYQKFKLALMRYIESPEFDLSHVLNDELLSLAQDPSTQSFLSL